MLKKFLSVALLVFITACSNVEGGSAPAAETSMPCCEKCECHKSKKCECCKDGMCKMCMGKMKDENSSSVKKGEKCPICIKAKKEQMKRK